MHAAEEALQDAFEGTALASTRLSEALAMAPASGSQLTVDDARFLQNGEPLVTGYIDARVENALVLLDEVRSVAERHEGVPGAHFDVIYQMLRACAEHATYISWILDPKVSEVRILRFIRLRRADERFAVRNHGLLVESATPQMPSNVGAALSGIMTAEAERVTKTYDGIADTLAVDVKASRAPVQTADVLKELHGEVSTPLAHWKMLSDLAHFSLSLKGMFDAPHDFGVPLRSVSMTVFLRQATAGLIDVANAVVAAKR